LNPALSVLRDLCGLLWAVAFPASILSAVMAFSVQRDRRADRSIDAEFEKDLSDMYDAVEKDPEYVTPLLDVFPLIWPMRDAVS
jgi:hypothetical protein